MHDCNFKVYDVVSYLNNNYVLFDILRREKYMILKLCQLIEY